MSLILKLLKDNNKISFKEISRHLAFRSPKNVSEKLGRLCKIYNYQAQLIPDELKHKKQAPLRKDANRETGDKCNYVAQYAKMNTSFLRTI